MGEQNRLADYQLNTLSVYQSIPVLMCIGLLANKYILLLAMRTQNVTIEILQDEVTVRAEAGTAAIPVRRNGFQEIAVVVE